MFFTLWVKLSILLSANSKSNHHEHFLTSNLLCVSSSLLVAFSFLIETFSIYPSEYLDQGKDWLNLKIALLTSLALLSPPCESVLKEKSPPLAKQLDFYTCQKTHPFGHQLSLSRITSPSFELNFKLGLRQVFITKLWIKRERERQTDISATYLRLLFSATNRFNLKEYHRWD